jgi:hypothetical protein
LARVTPGKSPYRKCEAKLHLYDYRVNQASELSLAACHGNEAR